LQSDVNLTSAVSIGEYKTTLQYVQQAVPISTDSSLNLILPILAKPIVQKIVDASILGVDTVLISNPTQESFTNALVGSITNAGPFDAVISFPSGLNVAWNGTVLGSMKMPNVNVVGEVGASINVSAAFAVANVDVLTSFTEYMLTQESFEWDITGENLTVTALGISVPGIALNTKKVTLKGFNGLKNGVVVKSFDLPSNDPAGGIHLTVQSEVTNVCICPVISLVWFANTFAPLVAFPSRC
jgi:hypothetical protein